MYKKIGKRVIDFVFSLILLIILFPVFIIISVIIRTDSKGPAIFKQVRTGKNKKNFILYKFRSMRISNNFYNKKEKDKITKVGEVLRKTSLDELPQLINILKGEMSFIGPRPWIIDYARHYNSEQRKRLDVLPGVTGLAQCSGRNNLSIFDRINIDIYYVDNLSLLLDIKIIFKTIKCILKREGFSNSKYAIHEEIKLLKNQHKKKKVVDEVNEEVEDIIKDEDFVENEIVGSEI
ncbi:MAG: sugar transferase [Bacilli bacterium]|nr:sugar transferase [Bacilli bacterium]